MRNITPVFQWAINNGESKIIERILLKLAPELIRADKQISPGDIERGEPIELEPELFNKIKLLAEEFVGQPYTDEL
ncbi:hypothetical protein [Thiomicrorhabdus indica]|uniref:hypothetical protein n=1 Tax=Thiomicrorhabdus indica TaxID=2267253 RepID=UPI002AA813EB|nr:hypothetical protein [Thiomicrorhabdus indica]